MSPILRSAKQQHQNSISQPGTRRSPAASPAKLFHREPSPVDKVVHPSACNRRMLPLSSTAHISGKRKCRPGGQFFMIIINFPFFNPLEVKKPTFLPLCPQGPETGRGHRIPIARRPARSSPRWTTPERCLSRGQPRSLGTPRGATCPDPHPVANGSGRSARTDTQPSTSQPCAGCPCGQSPPDPQEPGVQPLPSNSTAAVGSRQTSWPSNSTQIALM